MLRDLRQRRISGFGVLAAMALTGAAVLLLFPPERYGFYPRCPIYQTFGWLCPGCGGTRAAAALLRGHLREALRWNALVTLLALVCVPGTGFAAAAARYWPDRASAISGRLLERWQPPLAGALLACAAVFTVWRNLR